MMEDYKAVVEKRYNQREKDLDVFNLLHSDLQPIGF